METHSLESLLLSGIQPQSLENIQNGEQRLIDALDEAALRFSTLILDDSRDEAGKFLVDVDTRIDLFKLVRDWVAIRRRTDISNPQDDQSGVDALRKEMDDAKQSATTRANMPPVEQKRGRGRPTNAELEARREEKARADAEYARASRHDDSGLQAELAKAQKTAARSLS